MKNLVLTIFGLCCFALSASAQASHSVVLSWGASPDAAANPSLVYNVYRANSSCPASGAPSGASKIGSNVASLSYTDTAVSVGQSYCYYVTASLNSLESVPSNDGNAVILPAAPQTLSITVK